MAEPLQPGIAGAGCALLDILYPDADLSSSAFTRCASRSPGDGGLVPGNLVFAAALEAYTGMSVADIVRSIRRRPPQGHSAPTPVRNLGGPAVVALILAAQLLGPQRIPVSFYGLRGDDEVGQHMAAIVARTPLEAGSYRSVAGPSPTTEVLSDPAANDGAGERTFINTVGVAEQMRVTSLPPAFFNRRIAFYGGTALVPRLHAELGQALARSRQAGQLTVVATVYDFLNEQRDPKGLWPLGSGRSDYRHIDLLITDREEARRLSGHDQPAAAARQFLDWGSAAVLVTDGDRPVTLAAAGVPWYPLEVSTLPVSSEVRRRAREVPPAERDTTGCGDNFAGGVLADLERQRYAGAERLDLSEAVVTGICAGAAAWFQLGGTWIEPWPGAAAERVGRFRRAYREDIS